ncbi:hypothetical protein HK096_006037 [Nowakowskiella sp. JEL0078]|nr:hypothetical protein HK096_006037 [Nowakowskiella sp. JEL0078]
MAKSLYNGVETLPNISFDEANILDGIPYPDNYFDAVFQRFLIFGIPKNKWDFVIKELKRVTKPNGYIEMVEFDMDFQQTGPIWDIYFSGLNQAMNCRGLDIEIAKHLIERIESSGLEIDSETIRSIPVGWGGRVGDLYLKNIEMGASSMKPYLLKTFDIVSSDYENLIENIQLECPEFQTYNNVISVVGRKV